MELFWIVVLGAESAVASYLLAQRKGYRPGQWAGLGAIFGIFFIVVAVLVKPKNGHPQAGSTPWPSSAMLGLLVVTMAVPFTQDAASSATDQFRGTIQRIIDENIAENALRADYVTLVSNPIERMFATQESGFFTVSESADASSSDCDADTFDFTVRYLPNGNYSLEIDGPSMRRLNYCNAS